MHVLPPIVLYSVHFVFNVFSTQALETVLGELSDQLMEDLEDVDEYERNPMI